jgi:hypothetical protein
MKRVDITEQLIELLEYNEIKSDDILNTLLISLIDVFSDRREREISDYKIISFREQMSCRAAISKMLKREFDISHEVITKILQDDEYKHLVELKILINSVKKQVDSIRLYSCNHPKLEYDTHINYLKRKLP